MESVNVFWTIAKSAVFHIIVVSKNKRYPQFTLFKKYPLFHHILIFWDAPIYMEKKYVSKLFNFNDFLESSNWENNAAKMASFSADE